MPARQCAQNCNRAAHTTNHTSSDNTPEQALNEAVKLGPAASASGTRALFEAGMTLA
jgi:hypothetical protein